MTDAASGRGGLDAVRGRREKLHAAMIGLEAASSSPADDGWPDRVRAALRTAVEVVEDHAGSLEAAGGFYEQLARDAPHTLPRVDTLRQEHADITAEAQALHDACGAPAPSADELRERILGLVTALARHRHRGADLLFEAYQVDVSAAD